MRSITKVKDGRLLANCLNISSCKYVLITGIRTDTPKACPKRTKLADLTHSFCVLPSVANRRKNVIRA